MPRLSRTLPVLAVWLAITSFAGAPLERAIASGAKSPSPRDDMGLTYDAARGEVVLFGGYNDGDSLGDTWTWDGKVWTQQHPASSPSARFGTNMTYDAARGEVVLFGGGDNGATLGDTWTWDGTTWTQQHPATSPQARYSAGMAFDAARSDVVLFAGESSNFYLHDTWTWNGTTWKERHPATSPPPRNDMGSAFDAARAEVVVFGGYDGVHGVVLGDTWTWDGTDWTQQHPATSPSARYGTIMTSDDAQGDVVLFGGNEAGCCDYVGDTWTWDGTNWTQEHPATAPSARDRMAMTYDAARDEVVLFGGGYLGDTWIWDATTWRIPFVARVHLAPRSGPPGTVVVVTGSGFGGLERVHLTYIDSVNGKTNLGRITADATGAFSKEVTIPVTASAGTQKITAVGKASNQEGKATFTVT